jgi:hypothetical protein
VAAGVYCVVANNSRLEQLVDVAIERVALWANYRFTGAASSGLASCACATMS